MDLKISLKPELQNAIDLLQSIIDSMVQDNSSTSLTNNSNQNLTIEYLRHQLQQLYQANDEYAEQLVQIYHSNFKSAMEKSNLELLARTAQNPNMNKLSEVISKSSPELLDGFTGLMNAYLATNLNQVNVQTFHDAVGALTIIQAYIEIFNNLVAEKTTSKQLLEIADQLFDINVNGNISNIKLMPYHDISDITSETGFDEELIRSTRKTLIQNGLNLPNSYLIMVDESFATESSWSGSSNGSSTKRKFGRIRVYTDEETHLDERRTYSVDEINKLITTRKLFIDIYASGLKNLNTPFRKRIGIDEANDKHYLIATILSDYIDIEKLFEIKKELELLCKTSLNTCSSLIDKNISDMNLLIHPEQPMFGE